MTKTSWVEVCVSDFEQSITWFERVLGFRLVARNANEYAELVRGETTIQLAADDAPYWKSERPHLLPPGQRGSGVEIVLIVDNVEEAYHRAQRAGADIVRPLASYPWHMRQFWVRHPDGYLIRPAQRILSVNPTTYRRQIAEVFEGDTPHTTQELLTVKEAADQLARQGDTLGAATIYEMLVTGIFEQSHLYYDYDETRYDDHYDEEGYYPEEEGLEEFVGKCIEALGSYLADGQADRVAREKIIAALLAVYRRDVHAADDHGFAGRAVEQLVRNATHLERQTIGEWIRATLADEEQAITGLERQAYGRFWQDILKESLDDDAYLSISRETGRTADLVNRLLALGRIDEAIQETRNIDDSSLLRLADLFIQHGQDAVTERLVKARISGPVRPARDVAGLVSHGQTARTGEEQLDWRVLEWLQNYYRDRDNHDAELEIAKTLFRTHPSLKRYQELRVLSGRLDRWEDLRDDLLAFLEQARNTSLLIQIALDEGNIDQALRRLQEIAKKDGYGSTYTDLYGYYGFSDVAFEVARVAEELRPHAAIEIYRQFAERLIAMRDRKRYELATTYLVKVRALYEKLGEDEAWTRYITALREQNRNLRALQEELTKAGL
jgi:catechol 2,3-dioxygenase-like lactoylglutathione lyase family enzyme